MSIVRATNRSLIAAASCIFLVAYSAPSHAIVVFQNTDAAALVGALDAQAVGLVVTGSAAQCVTNTVGASSCGTYTNTANTYGIRSGIMLSSGNVSDYGTGPNTAGDKTTDFGAPATAAQEALLAPITGPSFHFDATQLDITFDSASGVVFFLAVFGSEEYPDFVNSGFVDGFGLYLNGVNIAFAGGLPVDINHPDMMVLAGTELNGVLASGGNPVLLFSGPANPIGNTLTVIVADTGDPAFDTTVYLAALSGRNPNLVAEPVSLALVGIGLAGLGALRRCSTRKRTVGLVPPL